MCYFRHESKGFNAEQSKNFAWTDFDSGEIHVTRNLGFLSNLALLMTGHRSFSLEIIYFDTNVT